MRIYVTDDLKKPRHIYKRWEGITMVMTMCGFVLPHWDFARKYQPICKRCKEIYNFQRAKLRRREGS